MKRDRWGNRAAFILAAVGSAAGLGNAWRFPYIVYKYGGGAFLIPYFVALLTAGIPLLIMEFSLGQKYQLGAPEALGKIRKKFSIIGWWTTLTAFFIVIYYAGVMAWIWDYIWGSFTVAWGNDAGGYFYNNVLQLSSGPGELGGFSIPVLIGVIITWIAIYLILRKGTESVGKVVWVTVTLPIALLIILMLRAVTLPGAVQGLNYYLQPDFSKLLDPQVWIAAYSQIFFTLSIGMGIMIAYSSYMPKDSDIVNNALITVFANSGVSFLAGFGIFGTLGYMAQTQGVPISEVAASGVGLAFVVYPNAINMLPGGPIVATIFGLIFFLTLLTLGIDSAFSLVEANVTAFTDKLQLNKRKITLWTIIVMGLFSLIFASKAGLYWLDIVDYYMNNYALLLGGLLECIAIGWFFSPTKLRDYFNPISEYQVGPWWDFMVKILTPAVLLYLVASKFYVNTFGKEPYGGYDNIYQWLGGWGLLIVMLIISVVFANIRSREIDSLNAETSNY
ncbi:sodium-dependent transporter [Halocella sp. SP3-1]|uniref:sodium-dependent transporter n=1 Tax=Halocella sp. SP3-1 TaxID=2382161 RepID=UPI000F754F27|nr:sodium-dependent transporter [Halocella sp. SP3-1]AZO95371.1 sodium-dependent transporter [Halocella sp. SP3-1]